jgi:hypothetical protein
MNASFCFLFPPVHERRFFILVLVCIFDILDPLPHPLHLTCMPGATQPPGLIQSHAQVPHRYMPFAARTFAIRVAAGEVALHQRTDRHETSVGCREALAKFRGVCVSRLAAYGLSRGSLRDCALSLS